MKLSKYKAKRDLKTSKEPAAVIRKTKGSALSFVVHEHHATHLHFDLRLEVDGVLKSWAVPKEPSMDPAIKRLAIQVEDHPYAYKDFKGKIPSGYGAGIVKIWDKGTYSIDDLDAGESEKAMKEGLKKGAVHFSLHGKKLKGVFSLIRFKKAGQWLLIKKREEIKAVSNLDKIYWPKEKITKGAMLRYYEEISPWILPYLKDRPVSLKRFPNGIDGISFFQKDMKNPPTWVKTCPIEHKNDTVHYLLIQNKETLLYAANLGSIELHPFFSRYKQLKRPDFMLFDIDPKGASFDKVIEVAKMVHEVLDEIEVPNYCKTSGATGLHIAVPLSAKYSFEEVQKFARLVAKAVHERLPKISTLERSLSKREGKVYIDDRQNNFAQTVAVPYGVRARPGAPVSTPLEWSEVKKGLDPGKYTIKTILARLQKKGDLFAPVLKKGIDLKKSISLLLKSGGADRPSKPHPKRRG